MKKNLKFEDAYNRLAEINGILVSDDVSLEESIKYFEEGIELTNDLDKELNEEEVRTNIEKLQGLISKFKECEE